MSPGRAATRVVGPSCGGRRIPAGLSVSRGGGQDTSTAYLSPRLSTGGQIIEGGG